MTYDKEVVGFAFMIVSIALPIHLPNRIAKLLVSDGAVGVEGIVVY